MKFAMSAVWVILYVATDASPFRANTAMSNAALLLRSEKFLHSIQRQ